MLKYYSKPVLTNEENSAYKKECKIDLSLIENNISDDSKYIRIKFKINIMSETIKNLLLQNKALFGIKISSSNHSEFINCPYENEQIYVTISTSNLKRIDKIKCTAYIHSVGQNQYKWNNELKDEYDKEFVFTFLDKEIIAVSDTEVLNYKAYGDSFVCLAESEEQNGKGLFFNIDKPNKIQVKIGTKLNEAFTKLRRAGEKYETRYLIDVYTIFSSITYALTKMALMKNLEQYKKYEWYIALDQNFDDEKYEDLDDFLNQLSCSDPIDLNEIYRVAQEILQNQLEIKIIETEELN